MRHSFEKFEDAARAFFRAMPDYPQCVECKRMIEEGWLITSPDKVVRLVSKSWSRLPGDVLVHITPGEAAYRGGGSGLLLECRRIRLYAEGVVEEGEPDERKT